MLKQILLLCLLFGFLTGIQAKEHKNSQDIPFEYKAIYQLKWHGVKVGKSQHVLRKLSPNRFVAETDSSPYLRFLPFESFERSEFTLHQHQIQPQLYQFKSQEKGKKLAGSLFFDWQQRTVKKNFQGQAQTLESIPMDAQDKITYLFQIQQQLMTGQKMATYTVIEPQKTKIYTVSIVGNETLNTAIGKLNTIKIEHVSENKDRRTQIWLASDRGYLMVKLVQIRKGKIIAEGNIQQFEQGGHRGPPTLKQ